MNIKLDDRLLTAASFVRKDSTVADIGCDHGRLSVYIAQNKLCKNIIAVDVNEPPLEKAKSLVKKHRLDDIIECRLGDGVNALSENEAEDIIIAGLSGVTIASIIDNAPWLKNANINLILVPAVKSEALRKYLYDNGFAINIEKTALAADRPYAVMCVNYTGNIETHGEVFYRLGLISNQNDYPSIRLKEKVLKQLVKERAGMSNESRYPQSMRDDYDRYINEVKKCIQ